MNNVEALTARNNLCTSCGICQSVCPTECIEFVRKGGQFVPQTNNEKCIECGICLNVCPGYKVNFKELYSKTNEELPKDYCVGNYISCHTAYTRDTKIRKNGVSGGIITTIVKELLDRDLYDVAFLVDSYEYNKFLETHAYRKGDLLTSTTKSRYVPVSHNNMVKYVLEHRDDKVIIVGTGCAVQGFINVISKFKLNRDNFLILGLFCDKTMNYNIFDYFSNYNKSSMPLKNLYFRTKESSGWPGHIKLEYENGDTKFLPAEERIVLKDYFQLEKCMYCIDKLNQFSDISLGDNYTGKNSSKDGSNSVIIRTMKGSDIWKIVSPVIESASINMEDIYNSQHIDIRMQNYEFASIKSKQINIDLYPDFPIKKDLNNKITYVLMKEKLYLIKVGRKYQECKRYFHLRIKYKGIEYFVRKVRRHIMKLGRGNR